MRAAVMDPMEWVFVLGVLVLFVLPLTVLNAFAVVALARGLVGVARWLVRLKRAERPAAARPTGRGEGAEDTGTSPTGGGAR